MTGSNLWTLYEEENYEGNAVCFSPGGTDGSPGFYGNIKMEGMMKKPSSVRKGCSAEKQLVQKVHGKNVSINGESGKVHNNNA